MRIALLAGVLQGCSVWTFLAPVLKNLPPPAVPDGVTAHRDIVFAERDSRDLHLDVYVPDNVDAPPLVVWMFGGGYFMGSRHSIGDTPPIWQLLQEGFAVAAIDYRYSNEALFPGQLEDATAALCWLRDHGGEVGVDSMRIAVAGESAGGHLASMTALTGVEFLDEQCGGMPPDVVAVVDYFGPTDFSVWTQEDSVLYRPIFKVFGGASDPDESRLEQANTLLSVHSEAPPFLVFHGTEDRTVPIADSEALVGALKELEVEVTWVPIDGAGHGGPEFYDDAVQQARVLDFLLERTDAL